LKTEVRVGLVTPVEDPVGLVETKELVYRETGLVDPLGFDTLRYSTGASQTTGFKVASL
jgi:hypothetical protein